MSERGWIAACPVCKWHGLVFTQEAAEAARSAHERINGHRGVTVHPATEVPGATRHAVGAALKQWA